MTTSSGILHSFLKESLGNKNTFSFEELLAYSRDECELIRIEKLPTEKDFFLEERSSHAVILYEDKLFYADARSRTIKALESTDLNQEAFDQLKKTFPDSTKKAKGHYLDLVMSVTGRAFNEHRSADFLPTLRFYQNILNDADKAMFDFMVEEKKKQLQFDLKITLLLLLAQKKHEKDYQKTENIPSYDEDIARCTDFLKILDPSYKSEIKPAPEQEWSDDSPIKYLAFFLGQTLAKELFDWMCHQSKTKTIREHMDSLNGNRLYWIWASSFLKTILSLVPEGYFYGEEASRIIRLPDPYTGCLSWSLYYFRFAINCSLLLKHTLNIGSSEEEAKTPWTERFQTQWAQRKFTLLNDSLWGTANLICFFWLTGKSAFSVWGDALTVVLLIFDISVSLWNFEEQKTQHAKEMEQFHRDIEALERARADSLNQGDVKEEEKIAQMKMQINALQRARAACARDWEFKKLTFINDIAYAVGLMLAFVILATPFMPIAAPVAAILGIAGATLCLAFTVINNAVKGGMELHKTSQTLNTLQSELENKKKELEQQQQLGMPLSNVEKFLYLEIQKLKADTKYQNQLMVYQSVNLARSIMLEVLVPVVIFASLVFLPLGLGVLPIAGVIGLALGSQMLIDTLCKPKKAGELQPFKEEDYRSYSNTFFENEPERKKGDDEEVPLLTP